MENNRMMKMLGVGLLGIALFPSLANAWVPPGAVKGAFKGAVTRGGEKLGEVGAKRAFRGTERVLRVTPGETGVSMKITDLTGEVDKLIRESAVKNLNKPKITEVTQVKPAEIKYYPMANKAADLGKTVLEEAVAGTELSAELREDINGLLKETSLCNETRKGILRQAAEKGASIEEVKGMIENAEMDFDNDVAALFDKYGVGDEFIGYLKSIEKYKLSVAQVEELIQSVQKLNLASDQIATRAKVMFGSKASKATNSITKSVAETATQVAEKYKEISEAELKEIIDAGTPATYVKKARIQARPAQKGETVETVLRNGVYETDNIGKVEAWVVTNPGGEEYIVPGEEFAKKYEPAEELGEGWYKPTGLPQTFVQIPYGIKLKVSWGEQNLGPGSFLNITNPEDIYGVAKEAFEETYQLFR